jgi:hypothetical protein
MPPEWRIDWCSIRCSGALFANGRAIVMRETRSAHRVKRPNDAQLAAIRRFFLQPNETYSIAELAALWRVPTDDVRDIYADHLARESVAGERIPWVDAVGTTVRFSMLRAVDIERALGAEFLRVRSERWCTHAVIVHIPRFIAEAIGLEPSLPSDRPLAARVEQILFELFATHERRSVVVADYGMDLR